MKNKGALIPLVVGLLFSAVFSGVGFYFLSANMDLDENGIHVDAIVVDMVTQRDSDGDNMYYPVVEFEIDNGETVTQKMTFGSSPPAYDIGEEVDVAYYEGDISSAAILSTFSMYVFPGIFIGIGSLFQFILVLVIISTVRRRKQGRSFVNSPSNNSTYSDANDEDEPLYEKSSDKDNKNPFIVD